jgi:8-oxo-dGTP pyrophosphatase MutT (NUDIX family)
MTDDRMTAVRHELARHRPRDARERVSLDEITALLDVLADPFDESSSTTHVTGSAIVVSDAGILLHLHRRLGRWLQPGGHVDGEEMPWDTATREVLEETGIAARHPEPGPTLVHVDVHPAARGHIHLDLRYLLTAPSAPPCPPPGESQQVRWVGWEEALRTDDAGLRTALLAARERD